MELFRSNKEETKNSEKFNDMDDRELTDEELEQVVGGPNFNMMMQFLTAEDLDYINNITSPTDKERIAKDLAAKRYYKYSQNNEYNLNNGKSK